MSYDNTAENIKRVEAVLFVSNKSISLKRLVEVLAMPPDAIVSSIAELNTQYSKARNSFFIEEVAGGYVFATRPEYNDLIRGFYNLEEKFSLTQLNLEVLSIVAYHQPTTRIEVDAIRGNIDSTFHVRTLLEKGFVKIIGRKKVPGSPFLYGTTKQFLTIFGLKSLSELPKVDEIKEEFKIKERKHETDTLPGFE